MTKPYDEMAETARRLKAAKAQQKLRPGGGYRQLATFQTATLIYDATWFFCENFLEPHSRLADQMVQAARSGRQNIAAADRASATPSQTELRLTHAARASLEELLLDFEDYLRHRRHPQWTPESDQARAIREIPQRVAADSTDQTDQTRWNRYAPWLEHDDPAIRANAIICLLHELNDLLDTQIALLEKTAGDSDPGEEKAGPRAGKRRKREFTEATEQPKSGFIPDCPRCGQPMLLRTAKTGKSAGQQFWGCPDYPKCKGALPV